MGVHLRRRVVIVVQFRGKDFEVYVMLYLFGVQFY